MNTSAQVQDRGLEQLLYDIAEVARALRLGRSTVRDLVAKSQKAGPPPPSTTSNS